MGVFVYVSLIILVAFLAFGIYTAFRCKNPSKKDLETIRMMDEAWTDVQEHADEYRDKDYPWK